MSKVNKIHHENFRIVPLEKREEISANTNMIKKLLIFSVLHR